MGLWMFFSKEALEEVDTWVHQLYTVSDVSFHMSIISIHIHYNNTVNNLIETPVILYCTSTKLSDVLERLQK